MGSPGYNGQYPNLLEREAMILSSFAGMILVSSQETEEDSMPGAWESNTVQSVVSTTLRPFPCYLKYELPVSKEAFGRVGESTTTAQSIVSMTLKVVLGLLELNLMVVVFNMSFRLTSSLVTTQ